MLNYQRVIIQAIYGDDITMDPWKQVPQLHEDVLIQLHHGIDGHGMTLDAILARQAT